MQGYAEVQKAHKEPVDCSCWGAGGLRAERHGKVRERGLRELACLRSTCLWPGLKLLGCLGASLVFCSVGG